MISRDDVLAASQRIAPHVLRTPVFTSRTLDADLDARVFAKAENLQRVGAFKARGATNAVLQLPDDTIAVATHSSGNHGQALSFAAALRDLPAWVVMPEDAEPLKVAAIRGYGGTVVTCPPALRDERTAEIVAETGATLVHPFNDEHVIAGQGTAALELLEEVADLDVIIAPIGGGGLLSGTVLAAGDDVTVIGAEPFAVDDAYHSLSSGELLPGVDDPHTVADGLVVGMGDIPFAILSERGTEIIRVEEDEILDAAAFFLERMKLVVEPSGATVLAALRRERDRFSGARIGMILSGGNTNLAWYRPTS